MGREFVERREGGFYVHGTRVPLDCIVDEYLNGEEPIAIQTHYDTLSLETVMGAIEYYLSHKPEVEAAMAERDRRDAEYDATHPNPPEIREKFERMRASVSARR